MPTISETLLEVKNLFKESKIQSCWTYNVHPILHDDDIISLIAVIEAKAVASWLSNILFKTIAKIEAKTVASWLSNMLSFYLDLLS